MRNPRRSRKILGIVLAGAVVFHATSCGTLLHPERRGQPPGGRLDPAIVLLDAAGLLLFLIPGLVAFAVDFSTGAIYLPPEYDWEPHASRGSEAPVPRPAKLVKVQFAKEELTRKRIEQVVYSKTGNPIDLEHGRYRAARLTALDRFEHEARQLADPSASAPDTQVAFP